MRTDMEIGEEYFYPSWPGKHIQVLHARWASSVSDYGKKVLGIIYKTDGLALSTTMAERLWVSSTRQAMSVRRTCV